MWERGTCTGVERASPMYGLDGIKKTGLLFCYLTSTFVGPFLLPKTILLSSDLVLRTGRAAVAGPYLRGLGFAQVNRVTVVWTGAAGTARGTPHG